MPQHLIEQPEHVAREPRHRARRGRHTLPAPGSTDDAPLAPVTTEPVVLKSHVRPLEQWKEHW